jgi:CubicO group peptidase (beta-lactamase class C family)
VAAAIGLLLTGVRRSTHPGKGRHHAPPPADDVRRLRLERPQHVLRQRGGQRDTDDARPRPYRYLLELPLAEKPGDVWNYNSGETGLLAAVLHKASGKRLDALAQEVLFDPLGIGDVEWAARYANGDPIAGWGLRMRPRDIAKVGQLVLDHGRWQGKQIVPEAWIAQSAAPQIDTGRGSLFYGYLWWLGRSLVERREVDWIAGFGLGGQRLYIVPERDLVVVVTAGLYRSPLQDQVGSTVLNHYVLPAAASH